MRWKSEGELGGFRVQRKEGNDMICLGEACPKREFLRNSMIWVFALTMGLLVSISDVKLPAETGVRADRLGHPIGGNAVFEPKRLEENRKRALWGVMKAGANQIA